MSGDFSFKTKPFQHQLTALNASKDARNYGLWMEMGTGKTKVVIDTAWNLYLSEDIDKVVVIAPKGVYLNWLRNELPVHAYEFEGFAWRSGMGKNEKALFERFLTQPLSKLKWLVVNVEALSSDTPIPYLERFIDGRTMVVVDESTRIKNHSAKRTKAVCRLGRRAGFRRVMSGSPITKNPLDLYSQCAFLDPNLLGFTSYYAFRNRYAIIQEIKAGMRKFPKIVGFRHQEELSEKLARFSYRVLKKDCLDLPPKVYERQYVELTPEQERAYQSMRGLCMAALQGTECTATSVLTQILRLHQIVCGHLKGDDGVVVSLPCNRLGVLMDVLEDVDKAIIWCSYQADVRAITAAIAKEYGPESVVTYYGETLAEERQTAIASFQTAPTCRFFVGTAQTGGLGITLTAADTVIYYSNSYNLEYRLQSEDRAHRIGQTRSVTYIDLVTPGTIDEKILNALASKQDIATLILDEIRSGKGAAF